ncbi:hypothetical protein GCM10018779_24120 [Streptomyces griseocarneus]|nr:hypothetical protein GCM10018779_24120 [Streptomyces griseocarneus]
MGRLRERAVEGGPARPEEDQISFRVRRLMPTFEAPGSAPAGGIPDSGDSEELSLNVALNERESRMSRVHSSFTHHLQLSIQARAMQLKCSTHRRPTDVEIRRTHMRIGMSQLQTH